ncbi:MAG: hypothetical protein U1C49_01590 [Candidatus Andersenbacteria bacterium]|nr:hypothetical protein [bacterium]MDZ4225520.1 hypothetical protein [Candidatus Andersenbacteria bacterium]
MYLNLGAPLAFFRVKARMLVGFIAMKYPIINFKFDQSLDQDVAWMFYNNQEFGGTHFWSERALVYHPVLQNMDRVKGPKKFLNQYIADFYSSHANELKLLGDDIVEGFQQVQDSYFSLVDKIFKGYPWPRKEFTGCFSIFDFCPRFLDWGGFQVSLFDKKEHQLYVIFHEMVHFIFYDYAQINFPDTLGQMDTDEGKFWDLAEVFNVVVQSLDDFKRLQGKVDSMGYPDHKSLILKGKNLWAKNPDVRQWILDMMA